jgi:DNA-binding YbaB/EbfC family protein
MQKAQKMQQELEKIQKEINLSEFTGVANSGLVTVVINGATDILSIEISDSLKEDLDLTLIADMVILAFNDAKQQANVVSAEKMKTATAGLPIPQGMKIPGLF